MGKAISLWFATQKTRVLSPHNKAIHLFEPAYCVIILELAVSLLIRNSQQTMLFYFAMKWQNSLRKQSFLQ